MNNFNQSKLSNVLAILSPVELKQLNQFLQSDSGSNTVHTVRLLDYLSAFYPDFNSPELSKSGIWKALFPETEYEDKKLRYLSSDLFNSVSKFLKYKQLDSNKQLSDSLLKEVLAARQADKAYLSLFRKDAPESAIDASGNADSYFFRYRDMFTHLNHYLPRQKRTGEVPLELTARYLDIFYITRKLQLLCEVLNSANVLSMHSNLFLKDEIISGLKDGAFDDVPVIAIYFRILMTLTEPDEIDHFEKLNHLLSTSAEGFTLSELRDMYQYLMNYCIRKINLGNTDFVNTLFEVYRTILSREIIFNEGMLSQWDYKNIVVIGIRSGNIQWVKGFIEDYRNRIPETERENAYIYNTSYYFYASGEYKKALNHFQKVEFNDLYYQLDMRVVLLKCYYEMGDEDALFYHLAAFKTFLIRNKLVSDYQRSIYRNLIRFTNYMINASHSKKQLTKILEDVERVRQVADIGWLKSQLVKLIGEF